MNKYTLSNLASHRRFGFFAAATLVVALAGSAFAQEAAKPDPRFHAKDAVKQYNVEKTVAISGYDPVAYFPEGGGKPKEGDKKITFAHNGITYRFASKEHLELFKASPEKYEPAHGGWCTYAMGATGEKVEIDPESYVVANGRLFLFYKDIFTDTRKKFLAEQAKLTAAADTSWKKTSGEEARTPEALAKKDAEKKDGDKATTGDPAKTEPAKTVPAKTEPTKDDGHKNPK